MTMKLKYTATDYGTERHLRLLDDEGRDLVPPRDPFYPCGLPLGHRDRIKRLNDCAAGMIAEYRLFSALRRRAAE